MSEHKCRLELQVHVNGESEFFERYITLPFTPFKGLGLSFKDSYFYAETVIFDYERKSFSLEGCYSPLVEGVIDIARWVADGWTHLKEKSEKLKSLVCSPKPPEDNSYRAVGNVVCVRDEDEHLDEVECLVWFNSEDDDNTVIKITTPVGMFELRDDIEVVFIRKQFGSK